MVREVKVGSIFYNASLGLYYKIIARGANTAYYRIASEFRKSWSSACGSSRHTDFFIKECQELSRLKTILLFE